MTNECPFARNCIRYTSTVYEYGIAACPHRSPPGSAGTKLMGVGA